MQVLDLQDHDVASAPCNLLLSLANESLHIINARLINQDTVVVKTEVP